MVIGLAIVMFITLIFIYLLVKETICCYRNPFPLFKNDLEKRFSEIKIEKTRNILDDLN